MLAYLKNQPLIGLGVAVTTGIVMAHFIIRAGDSLYDDYPNLPYIAASCILLLVTIWLRRPLLAWLFRHRGKLAVAATAVTALYLFGVYHTNQHQKYLQSMAQPSFTPGQPVYLDPSTGNPIGYSQLVNNPPALDKCALGGGQADSVACTQRRKLQKMLHIPTAPAQTPR